jgi:hypothetical protein
VHVQGKGSSSSGTGSKDKTSGASTSGALYSRASTATLDHSDEDVDDEPSLKKAKKAGKSSSAMPERAPAARLAPCKTKSATAVLPEVGASCSAKTPSAAKSRKQSAAKQSASAPELPSEQVKEGCNLEAVPVVWGGLEASRGPRRHQRGSGGAVAEPSGRSQSSSVAEASGGLGRRAGASRSVKSEGRERAARAMGLAEAQVRSDKKSSTRGQSAPGALKGVLSF